MNWAAGKPGFFGWYKRECEEQIANYRIKLAQTDGPNLKKWAARLKADEGALSGQEEPEKVLFSKGVYGVKDRAAVMKSVGQEEEHAMANSEENILSFSSGYFVNHRA